MLVIGKNFPTQSSNNMTIVGIIEDQIIRILTQEQLVAKFPNNGRAFVPPAHRSLTVGNFMIYKVEPSNTFYSDNPNSSYYTVANLERNYPLIEVLDIKENYKTDKEKITEYIQTGFFKSKEPLPNILLRTADDFLIGPFKCSYDIQTRRTVFTNDFELSKYFIDVFDNSNQIVNISFYKDEFDEVERAFTVQYPHSDNLIGQLDIATNEYSVMEAIKFLRGHEKFGDLTRRAIRELNDWIQDIDLSEANNVKRLNRSITILKQISPFDQQYDEYLNEIKKLHMFDEKVKRQLEKRFLNEYEIFIQENNSLLNENKSLKSQSQKLEKEIKTNKKSLEKLQKNISEYTEFMNQRKNNMEEEFLSYYVQNLTNLQLNNKNEAIHKGYFLKENKEKSVEFINSMEDAKRLFKQNLRTIEERDIGDRMFNYILLTLKFNQPLFLIGEGAYKLAEIIMRTFTALYNKSLIPDTDFSIEQIEKLFQSHNEELSFTHIHNIQVSPTSLNLSGFIKEYEKHNNNNKVIFTFNSFEESEIVIEDLESYLVLDVTSKSFFSSPFEEESKTVTGQIDKKLITEGIRPLISHEESLRQIEKLIFAEELNKKWKLASKKIKYTNQLLKSPKRAISYFPFIEKEFYGEEDVF